MADGFCTQVLNPAYHGYIRTCSRNIKMQWITCLVAEYSTTVTTGKTAYCTTVLVKMVLRAISEPPIVKHFLGEHAPRPP